MSSNVRISREIEFKLLASDVNSSLKLLEQAVESAKTIKTIADDGITVSFIANTSGNYEKIIREIEDLRKPVPIEIDVDSNGNVASKISTIKKAAEEIPKAIGAGFDQLENRIHAIEKSFVQLKVYYKEAMNDLSGENKKGVSVPVVAARLTVGSFEEAIKDVKSRVNSGDYALRIPVKPKDIQHQDIDAVIKKANSYARGEMTEDVSSVQIPTALRKISEGEVKATITGTQNLVDAQENGVNIKAKLSIAETDIKKVDTLVDATANIGYGFTNATYAIEEFSSVGIDSVTPLRNLLRDMAEDVKAISKGTIHVKHTASQGASSTTRGSGASSTSSVNAQQEAERIAKRLETYIHTFEVLQEALDLPLEEQKALLKEYEAVDKKREATLLKEQQIRKAIIKDEERRNAKQEKLLDRIQGYKNKIDAIASNPNVDTSQISGFDSLSKTINSAFNQVNVSTVLNPSVLQQIESSLTGVTTKLKDVSAQAKQIEKDAKAAEAAALSATSSSSERISALIKIVGNYVASDPMFKVADSNILAEFLGSEEDLQHLREVRDQIKELFDDIRSFNGELSSDDANKFLERFAKLRGELQRSIKATDKMPLHGEYFEFLDADKISNAAAKYDDVKKKILEINDAVNAKNLTWTVTEQGDIVKLTGAFEDQAGTLKTLSYEYDVSNGKLKELGTTEKSTLSFMERINRLFKQRSEALIAYIGTFASFYRVIGSFKKGYEIIKTLDTNMTELRRVSGATETQLQSFRSTVFDVGREVGSTADNIIKLAADYSRLGYSLNESKELASATAIYMNVGFIEDADFAMESLTSTLKAYGMQASEVSSIVDKFNEVGNNFAISSEGIGEALQRSAAALAQANNNLDKSIALVVAANDVVQNPETVGTALRTVALRIRSTKSELES